MENASKALIMAGGVLISIIIISMFMLMINDLASYEQNEDDIKRQEQTVAFNEQFDGYNRSDVQGNELISLLKKVADYNLRKTSAQGANEGNDGYEPIEITIDITDSSGNLVDFSNNLDINDRSFREKQYVLKDNISTSAVKSPLNDIITEFNKLESGKEQFTFKQQGVTKDVNYDGSILNNLVKGYNKIFISNFNSSDYRDKLQVFDNVNSIFGQNIFKLYKNTNELLDERELDKLWEDNLKNGTEFRKIVDIYFEYVQFKRADFKCEGQNGGSGVEYNPDTGRIKSMYFKFTGGI